MTKDLYLIICNLVFGSSVFRMFRLKIRNYFKNYKIYKIQKLDPLFQRGGAIAPGCVIGISSKAALHPPNPLQRGNKKIESNLIFV